MSRIAHEKFDHSPTRALSIEDVLQQIEAEYQEMPGLTITEAQALRLWALDNTTCRLALDTLVQRGILRRTRQEEYVRAEFSRLPAVSKHGGVSRRAR